MAVLVTLELAEAVAILKHLRLELLEVQVTVVAVVAVVMVVQALEELAAQV
jgi:hypothetical protein